MTAERKRKDLRQKETQTNHSSHSSECLQPLRGGRGLNEGIKPHFPWLVEQRRFHIRDATGLSDN